LKIFYIQINHLPVDEVLNLALVHPTKLVRQRFMSPVGADWLGVVAAGDSISSEQASHACPTGLASSTAVCR